MTVELEIEAGLANFPLDASGATDALRKATSATHESTSMTRGYLWHGSCFDASHRRTYSSLRDISPPPTWSVDPKR